MKHLDKYNTDTFKVEVIEEDGISIVYFIWSIDGEVQTKSIFWIPTQALEGWLSTDMADKVIRRKIEALNTVVQKEEEEVVEMPIPRKLTGREKIFKNSETGEVVMITNVAQFCRERNIPYGSFKKMVQGRNKTSHNWFMLD